MKIMESGEARARTPVPGGKRENRSPLRYPAAAGAVVAATAHLPLIPQYLAQAPYMGLLFVAVMVAFLVLGWALLRIDVTPVWAATGATAGLAVATYATSRSVPLPRLADEVGRWTEPLGLVPWE